MSILNGYSQLSSKDFDCEIHYKEVFTYDEFSFLNIDQSRKYILPSFHYVSNIIEPKKWEEAYTNVVNIFDLTIDIAITPEQVQKISVYKAVVQEQLDRQVRYIEYINNDLVESLREFFFAHFNFILSQTKSQSLIQDDLDFSSSVFSAFFTKSIIVGELGEGFMKSWSIALEDLESQVSNELIEETTRKLDFMINHKENILLGAEQLAAKLFPLSTILLDAVFNNQLMSPEDYHNEIRKSKFPDPEMVANKYLERKENKKSKEGYEYIGQIIAVMEETRLFISNEKCTNIFGLLSEIERVCRVKVKNLSQDIKTVKNWIVFYAKEAGVKNDNPLKSKIEHKINKS